MVVLDQDKLLLRCEPRVMLLSSLRPLHLSTSSGGVTESQTPAVLHVVGVTWTSTLHTVTNRVLKAKSLSLHDGPMKRRGRVISQRSDRGVHTLRSGWELVLVSRGL